MSKPAEVEELVDQYIHRPLAARLIPLLVRTPITPNQVTILSGLTGIAAGVCFALGAARPVLCLVAGVLLFVSVVLDCSDGQLARARGISSTTGAILDGIADYLVGIALAIGGSYYMATTFDSPWFWLLGVAGAASSALQAALFDHAKTRYTALVGYSEREEDVAAVIRNRQAAQAEGRWGDVLLFLIYERYSKVQHAAMRIDPVNDPVAYRKENAGRMRAWTWLGIGTHFALAYVLCALAAIWPVSAVVYFLFCATVLNVYLAALMAIEPRRVGE